MNEDAREDAAQDAAATDPEAGAAGAADAPASSASSESPESPEEALAAALADAERFRDAALRAQAETENVRRRSQRDVEAAHKFALEKFAAALLPIADSLEKSVEAVTGHSGGDEEMAAIKEGIELSERLFRDTLGKFDVEAVDPVGAPFDPERHEAMAVIEAPQAEPNSVVDVLQKGYLLNGRLLRAAMVVVSKGSS